MTLKVIAPPKSVFVTSVNAMTSVNPITTSIRLPISIPTVRYIGPKFRVKLSYLDPQSAILSTVDGKIGKLTMDGKKILSSLSQKYEIGIV